MKPLVFSLFFISAPLLVNAIKLEYLHYDSSKKVISASLDIGVSANTRVITVMTKSLKNGTFHTRVTKTQHKSSGNLHTMRVQKSDKDPATVKHLKKTIAKFEQTIPKDTK